MNNDPRFDALLKKSLAGLKESNQTVCAEVSNKSLIADYLERQNARMRTQIFRSN
jgi:FtsZ-binding cell division protein ZapB